MSPNAKIRTNVSSITHIPAPFLDAHKFKTFDPGSNAVANTDAGGALGDNAKSSKRFLGQSTPEFFTSSGGNQSEEGSDERKLFAALTDAKIFTSTVAMHLDSTWRKKLFRQLDSLHDIEEWEEGEEAVRLDSFKTFLRSYLAISPKKNPGFALTREGLLIATWTEGQDRLTLEFGADDAVRWSLSCELDGSKERVAGDTWAKRLEAVLAAYQPDRWFKR